MITFQQFNDAVYNEIKNRPSWSRKGQAAFNYIDYQYGVARLVQFEDHIDCFYDDNEIERFIAASYKRICENLK